MPLVNYEKQQIEIEVTDRIIGETIVKQKAKFVNLTHNQVGLESTASIIVLVTLYALENGGYGAELKGAGFAAYPVVLVADNNTIVDAETGAIVAVRTNESNELWRAKADLAEQPVMYQGDFFEMIRDAQAVKIGDMIKQYIIQANLMGKFK